MELPALFAVVGNPVLHSLSPAMHNAAFEALDVPARYLRLHARDAQGALRTARAMGLRAFNITAPFKEDFAKLAGRLSEEARAVGAVNTFDLRPAKTVGYNTDIDGVVSAIRGAGLPIRGRRAVVVGAGGAARAAAWALLSSGAEVAVANRTLAKARSLARALGCRALSLKPAELGPALAQAEIVVSAVSTSQRVIPPRLLPRGALVVEAVYSRESALVRDALAAGCGVVDGRAWLLYQGALAFRIFTGLQAPLGAMWGALEKARPPRFKNLALIGLPGSGKSAVARELERASGMKAIDLDQQVERVAGRSVPEIFAERGERAFRKLEREQLARQVRRAGVVLSCGGGAVVDRANAAALRRSLVVWLWADPASCARRIPPGTRPKLAQLLSARREAYARACQVVVDTEGLTPRQVAREVAAIWEQGRGR
jgi:shikimate dehydrogenase